MTYIKEQWRENKLRCALVVCWLLTGITSFFGSFLFPVELSGFGTWYAFRTMLPITAILYIIYACREKIFFWKDSTTLEKWCYVFIASLIVCSALSIPRAIDTAFTMKRIVNLMMDLVFFFLALRLCRDRAVRKLTVRMCAVLLAVIMILGIYEVFFGGIVDPAYNKLQKFYVFFRECQMPAVFSGNTNDYNASVVMLLAVLLMSAFAPEQRETDRRKLWYLVPAFAVGFFLALAGGARLCKLGYFILLLSLFAYAWAGKRKKCRWAPVLVLCCFLCAQFVAQSHYILPQAKEFFSQAVGNNKSLLDVFRNPESGNPQDEFIKVDEETGEAVINDNRSGGARLKLLIHAEKCLLDSKGLGVGIGNTEMLARDNSVIQDTKYWNIHCFLARLAADCGVFAIVPLAAIAYLMLRKMLRGIVAAVKGKDRAELGYNLLLLGILAIFPIVSTASSDAQDILPMWLYLAMLVLHCVCTSATPQNRQHTA